jgi:hypothetical protein
VTVDPSELAILFADGTFTALISGDLRAERREALTWAAAARAEGLRDVAFRPGFATGFGDRLVFTERLFMEQL